MKILWVLLIMVTSRKLRRPYDKMPLEYHLERFTLKNAWINKVRFLWRPNVKLKVKNNKSSLHMYKRPHKTVSVLGGIIYIAINHGFTYRWEGISGICWVSVCNFWVFSLQEKLFFHKGKTTGLAKRLPRNNYHIEVIWCSKWNICSCTFNPL